jgi:hypothetical protein
VDFLLENEELPLEGIISWAQRVNTTSDCDVQQKVGNWNHGGRGKRYHVMRLERGALGGFEDSQVHEVGLNAEDEGLSWFGGEI